MKFVARFVYRFLIMPLLLLLAHLAGIFNQKINKAVSGRYQAIRILRNLENTKPIVLIHASSLGEFEHVRPLIYRLGKRFRIIVTFFSPSGFNHAKKSWPDEVQVYLPFDVFFLWKKLFAQLKPRLLIISKHDVWPSQVLAAKKNGVPVFLVNGSLAEKSSRLNPFYRFFLKEAYQALDTVFTISEKDAERFKKYFNPPVVKVMGDTKFDQALIRKERAMGTDLIESSWVNDSVLVLGSIWSEDFRALEPGLAQLMKTFPKLKIIAVPHQPSEIFVKLLLDFFKPFGVTIFTKRESLSEQRAIVVDVVGVLADLYKYASWAYVGGSFKQGIHNVMEAAVYGIPVMFGPVHENSFEALDLVRRQGAFVIKTSDDFFEIMQKLLKDPQLAKNMGAKTESYVKSKTGTTERLLIEWQEVLGKEIK